MEPSNRFDLDQAVAAWRAELARHPGPASADLRELEAHLRDGFAELKKKDLSDEEAFLVARHRIGPPKPVAGEFAKRTPQRVWRSRVFWWTFIAVFGSFAGYAFIMKIVAPIYQATATLRVNKVMVSAMQSSPTADQISPEELNTDISLVAEREVAQTVADQMTPQERQDFLFPFYRTNPSDPEANLVDRLMTQRMVSPGRQAYTINVWVEHPDPKITVIVANDFVRAFIELRQSSSLAVAEQYQIVDPADGQVIETAPKTLPILVAGLLAGLAAAIVLTLLMRLLSSSRPPPPPAESVL